MRDLARPWLGGHDHRRQLSSKHANERQQATLQVRSLDACRVARGFKNPVIMADRRTKASSNSPGKVGWLGKLRLGRASTLQPVVEPFSSVTAAPGITWALPDRRPAYSSCRSEMPLESPCSCLGRPALAPHRPHWAAPYQHSCEKHQKKASKSRVGRQQQKHAQGRRGGSPRTQPWSRTGGLGPSRLGLRKSFACDTAAGETPRTTLLGRSRGCGTPNDAALMAPETAAIGLDDGAKVAERRYSAGVASFWLRSLAEVQFPSGTFRCPRVPAGCAHFRNCMATHFRSATALFGSPDTARCADRKVGACETNGGFLWLPSSGGDPTVWFSPTPSRASSHRCGSIHGPGSLLDRHSSLSGLHPLNPELASLGAFSH
jgi:hypothetical protein